MQRLEKVDSRIEEQRGILLRAREAIDEGLKVLSPPPRSVAPRRIPGPSMEVGALDLDETSGKGPPPRDPRRRIPVDRGGDEGGVAPAHRLLRCYPGGRQ